MSDERHLEPPEDPKAPHPDDGIEACSDCKRFPGPFDDDFSDCPGFNADPCDHKVCECCKDRWGRCSDCGTRAYQATKAFHEGRGLEPWIDPEMGCCECGQDNSDGASGTFCSECNDAFCTDHFTVGSDGKARCEACAKEKVGL